MSVAVDVVDLKRQVVGGEGIARVRLSDLPQNLTFESDGSETSDLSVVVWIAHYVLRDQQVGLAVAIKISKADVAACAKVAEVHFFPELRLRIFRAQARQLGLALMDSGFDAVASGIRG